MARKFDYPESPAVYSIWFMQENGICIYVGATENLYARIRKLRSAHPMWFRANNIVRWEPCKLSDLKALEVKRILELSPIANRTIQGYSGKRGKKKISALERLKCLIERR